MGSPVTLSGFNKIDFSVILNAVMQQEAAPLTALQTEQRQMQSQVSAFATLATKLGALKTAADSLTSELAFSGRSVTVTDSTIVSVSPGTTASIGTYDIVVNELARAQVTGTTSSHTDTDTTTVATGGTLTIGGVDVTVTGALTLQGLADAINGTTDIPVTATIVSPSSGTYQLVLTGNDTGATNAFTITNNMTGGSGVTFSATNAVDATNASAVVNGITVTDSTNTLTSAIPGATLTLQKKATTTTVTATISQDTGTTKTLVQSFVDAYNDVVRYTDAQVDAATGGDASSIGRDSVLRSLRYVLQERMNAAYSVGGSYSYAAEVGIGYTSIGELDFDETVFDTAAQEGVSDIQKLFLGSGGTDGLFAALQDTITEYTQNGGLVPDAQTRLNTQIDFMGTRIDDMSARLTIRRAALQREYIAYDQIISRLNNQNSALSSLGSVYRIF